MKKGNFELIGEYSNSDGKKYNVFVDAEGLNLLIDDIVEKAGYMVESDFCLTSGLEVNLALKKINRHKFDLKKTIDYFPSATPELPNHAPLYRDITEVRVRDIGYGKVIDFHGKRMVAPRLAIIIDQIICYGDKDAIKEFFDYKNQDEIISIDDKIDLINKKMSGVKSANCTVEEINRLANLLTAKAYGHYFNTELLKEYYGMASRMIKLQDRGLSRKRTIK